MRLLGDKNKDEKRNVIDRYNILYRYLYNFKLQGQKLKFLQKRMVFEQSIACTVDVQYLL